MGNLYNIFTIGQSGVDAAQFGARTTAQNVANVNTPGYHRRVVVQEQANISTTAVPQLGDGVRVLGVERIIDQALDRRARNADSESQASETRANILGRANVAFGDIVGEGLSPAFDSLLASFDELAATPQDPIARRGVLGAAELFAAEVRRYGNTIADIRRDVDNQLEVEVDRVNSLIREISEANRLVTEEVQPNVDLLDRRDRLVGELAEELEIVVSPREDGSVDIHLAETGYTLVAGRFYSELSLDYQPDGARLIGFGFGGVRQDLTGRIRSGVIGGILLARDEDLVSARDNLDGFAYEVATQVNQIHAAGYGSDGQTGRNLFLDPTQREGAAVRFQVDPAVVGDPAAVAAAQTLALAEGGNGAALQLAAFRRNPTINGLEPPEALQGILQDFGDRVYRAEINAVSRGEAATQLRDLQQSMSGVSLDEEMANLVRYQQAYAAAVQVMQTADQLMQELMSIKR